MFSGRRSSSFAHFFDEVNRDEKEIIATMQLSCFPLSTEKLLRLFVSTSACRFLLSSLTRVSIVPSINNRLHSALPLPPNEFYYVVESREKMLPDRRYISVSSERAEEYGQTPYKHTFPASLSDVVTLFHIFPSLFDC